ncbi:MAG: hypothetical protein AAGH15_18200 [Myxococcota bacterium]
MAEGDGPAGEGPGEQRADGGEARLDVTAYVTVTQLPGEPILIFARSSTPFPMDETELETVFEGMDVLLGTTPRDRLHLVMDLREGPGRNDAAFERVQRKYRSSFFGAFRSTHVVVRSTVGRMQVERYERDQPTPVFAAFEDLEKAIAAARRAARESDRP